MIPLHECSALRDAWEQYGTNPPKGLETIVNKYKKQYQDGGCGKDVLMEKCFGIEKYIKNLRDSIAESTTQGNLPFVEASYPVLVSQKNKFSSLGCEKKVEQYKQTFIKTAVDKYTTLDEQRIEAESKYQANVRIFIGVSILVIGLTVILTANSE